MKKVTFKLSFNVPEDYSKEQIAELLQKSINYDVLKSSKVEVLTAKDDGKDLLDSIEAGIVERDITINTHDPATGGYEGRLWAKATC